MNERWKKSLKQQKSKKSTLLVGELTAPAIHDMQFGMLNAFWKKKQCSQSFWRHIVCMFIRYLRYVYIQIYKYILFLFLT